MSTGIVEDYEAMFGSDAPTGQQWQVFRLSRTGPTPHRDHIYLACDSANNALMYYKGSIFKVSGKYHLCSNDSSFHSNYIISTWDTLEGAMAAYKIAAATKQFRGAI